MVSVDALAEAGIDPASIRVADDAIAFATQAARASTYIEGERLVRLADPMQLPDVAARHDVEVVRPVGRSGFAVVRGTEAAMDNLVGDPAVAEMVRHGRILGATDTTASDVALMKGADDDDDGYQSNGADEDMQWYREKVDPPSSSYGSNVVVAVLDTGVAYETAVRYGVAYTQAPSLASSAIVAPYDFVNDDPHANDDHQHGTHIASIIASNGTLRGTAPGAKLMPIKVLDADNMGHEYSLIEGIWWAIDNGADIINMSLSFGPSYHGSPALRQALDAAAAADILVVAASGNDGLDQISWPAASPN
ncbi:MAG: S8 family serine peptidase, partial [Myxococcota bacterium]